MRWWLVLVVVVAGCGIVDSKYYERLVNRGADAGADEDDAGSAPDAAAD